MDTPKLQIAYWLAGSAGVFITAIVQRKHLKEFFQAFWKPLSLLLLIAGAITAYFLGWFSWVGDLLHWFAHPVALPVWGLCLLLVACILIITVVWLVSHSVKRANTLAAQPMDHEHHLTEHAPLVEANPYDYKQDIIYGALWTWSYIYQKINERSLVAFCPDKRCKNRLDVADDYDRMSNPQLYYHTIPVKLICSRCGFSTSLDFDRHNMLDRVAREIERRINTGEYAERLRQLS